MGGCSSQIAPGNMQYNNLKFCLNARTLSEDLLAGSWQKALGIYKEYRVVFFNHSVLLKVFSMLVQSQNVLLSGIELF